MSLATWKAKHDEDRAVAARGGVDLLFLGDSITEGWADQPLWGEAFGRFRPANFGIGGDTTRNLLWRLGDLPTGRLDPKAIVLLIGTNNFGLADDSPEEVFRGVAAVVERLRSLFPEARILLLGIFPVDERPDSRRRRAVEAANARIASLDDGEKVVYLDIGGRFPEPDGTLSPRVMPDFLHLAPEGYRRWADGILPTLKAWLE
jgi:lysophospholipase L1-like esterase